MFEMEVGPLCNCTYVERLVWPLHRKVLWDGFVSDPSIFESNFPFCLNRLRHKIKFDAIFLSSKG